MPAYVDGTTFFNIASRYGDGQMEMVVSDEAWQGMLESGIFLFDTTGNIRKLIYTTALGCEVYVYPSSEADIR